MKTKSLLLTAAATLCLIAASPAQNVPNYVPTNGLVGWWPFNGNANDESGNGNNGTVNGATLTMDRNGQVNKAYSFNNSSILVPNSNSLQINNQFTLSIWINANSFPSPVSTIFSKGPDLTPFTWIFYINTSGFGGISVQDNIVGGGCGTGNTIAYSTNNWINLTSVIDGNTSKFYVNGVLDNTMNCSSSIYQNAYDVCFGKMNHPTFHYYWDGKLDDIGIWNRALSQQEITALYAANCVPPVATVTAAGPTSFCSGGSVQLNTAANPAYTYQWQNNGVNIPGATNASYTANAAGSYTVIARSSANCADTSAPMAVTVNALPSAAITAAGPTTFCSGVSVVLNANTATGLSYQWRRNGTTITGATSASYTATTTGAYTVVVSNSNNCQATSAATSVTVNALPQATVAAAGPTTFCSGASVVLNANTGTGLSYQWQQNGTTISGATSAAYTATTSGSYTVLVRNSNNCSATSTAITVTVNPAPQATATAAGPTTFCSGASVVLNANTGTGLSYQWRRNGTTITGATSASYTATTTGAYTVLVRNTSNCSATSPALSVTVNALPSVNLTTVPAFVNFQGGSIALNGTPPGGAFTGSGVTGSTFLPSAAGLGRRTITYSYTNTAGCSNKASQNTIVYDTTGIVCTSYDTVILNITVTDTLLIQTTITSLSPPNNKNTIRVYPNPTNDHITIYYGNFTSLNGYQLKIENSLGQQVFQTNISQQFNYLSLTNWGGSGLYFVRIIDPQGNTIDIRKIVLQ